MQIATGDVQHRVHVEVAFAFPQLEEVDLLGMAQQPGSFVIQRVRTFFELADAKRDPKAAALGAETATGWNSGGSRRTGCARHGTRCHED
jgi:hypothetical protein